MHEFVVSILQKTAPKFKIKLPPYDIVSETSTTNLLDSQFAPKSTLIVQFLKDDALTGVFSLLFIVLSEKKSRIRFR